MSGVTVYDAVAIMPIFFLVAICWAVMLVVIWNDADEVYGTGFFWAFAVLIAPVVAIPAYWLMRLGTHRSLNDEIIADERLARRKAMGQRFSGLALDLDRQLGNAPARSQLDPEAAGQGPAGFKPFTPTFAAEAESWRRRTARGMRGQAEPTDAVSQSPPVRSQRDLGAGEAPPFESNASSQGCGDSAGTSSLNERLSWRHRQTAVKSRWDTSRQGSVIDAGRGLKLP